MADKELVLCEPLCFISNKFGKLTLNVLKNAVTDFYNIDDLVEAKIRLLHDVNLLEFAYKLPHIPKRRGETNRSAHEVDDIFALFQFVDEHGQLPKLPRYVSCGPDMMPSIRLFEGDMHFLLARLDRLENNLASFGSALAAITTELQCVRQASSSSKVSSTRQQLQAQQQVQQQPNTVNRASAASTATTSSGKTTTSSSNDNNTTVIISKPSWADRTSSTPKA